MSRTGKIVHTLSSLKDKCTVDDDGCWIIRNKNDYYNIRHDGGYLPAHRLSLMLKTYGKVVSEPRHALHKCDKKNCVNPNCLSWGSQKQNSVQASERGLMRRGSQVGLSKLKETDVVEIKNLLEAGVLQKDIAELFNIDRSAISRIKNKKVWMHVC